MSVKQVNDKLKPVKQDYQNKPLSNVKDTFFTSSHKQLVRKANSILSKKQEDAQTKNVTSKSIENDTKSGIYETPSKSQRHNSSHFEQEKINTSDSDIIIKSSLSSTIDRLKMNPE